MQRVKGGVVTTIGGKEESKTGQTSTTRMADVRPFGVGILSPIHCTFVLDEATHVVTLMVTAGRVMLNGVRLQVGAEEILCTNDRVSFGQHTWLLCHNDDGTQFTSAQRWRILAPVLCDAVEVSLVAVEAELVSRSRAEKGRSALKSLFRKRETTSPGGSTQSAGLSFGATVPGAAGKVRRPSGFRLARTAALARSTEQLSAKPIEGWTFASLPLDDEDMVLEATLGRERAERSGAHARRLVRDIDEATQLCAALGRPEIRFAIAPPVSFFSGESGDEKLSSPRKRLGGLEAELDETEFLLVSASDPLVPSAQCVKTFFINLLVL